MDYGEEHTWEHVNTWEINQTNHTCGDAVVWTKSPTNCGQPNQRFRFNHDGEEIQNTIVIFFYILICPCCPLVGPSVWQGPTSCPLFPPLKLEIHDFVIYKFCFVFPLLSASCPPLCDRGQLVAPLFSLLKLKIWWFQWLKINSPLLSGGQLGCPLISRSWNKIQSEIPLLTEWRKSLSNPSISKSLVVQSYLLTYVDRTPAITYLP